LRIYGVVQTDVFNKSRCDVDPAIFQLLSKFRNVLPDQHPTPKQHVALILIILTEFDCAFSLVSRVISEKEQRLQSSLLFYSFSTSWCTEQCKADIKI